MICFSKYRSKVENCLKDMFSQETVESFRASKLPYRSEVCVLDLLMAQQLLQSEAYVVLLSSKRCRESCVESNGDSIYGILSRMKHY